ncbi:CaiB/BaiF CoA transferase family protein [Longivirga aurantiaca]|uniref:CaiB/BaiF CoA transferase family protein n=1 Tax=Longivirga aurantiaca TaxID=1837743 RepID=A0ABW1T3F7_9ACTN
MTTSERPLDGVRVVDLTRLLPGAYATSLLLGMGADVVKIEDPRGGDGLRVSPPYSETGESGLFLALCRGKRSVALDLKTDVARDALLRLVSVSHVVIDSFRPGVLDRLGLGPAELAAANPALVHVSMTAYGDGGRAALPGHDLNVEGYAGILGLSRGIDGATAMPPFPIADMASGLQAALAVVAGLRVAEAQDSPSTEAPAFRADVTMLDSAMSLTAIGQGTVMATGEAPPVPDVLTGALACYGVYRCADGTELALGALEPKFFARVAELAGDPTLADAQYDITGQDALRGRLTLLFATRPREEWLALLEHDQTCVTPVRTSAEALADPDLQARGAFEDVVLADGRTTTAARPVAWLPADGRALAAPALGEHTDEVLRAIGLDPGLLG